MTRLNITFQNMYTYYKFHAPVKGNHVFKRPLLKKATFFFVLIQYMISIVNSFCIIQNLGIVLQNYRHAFKPNSVKF